MKMIEMLLQSHPRAETQQIPERLAVISALAACEQACGICADACLGESNRVESLLSCIQACLDCADVCAAALRLLTRRIGGHGALLRVAQLHACAAACQLCADACDPWVEDYNHCRLCVDVCFHCKEQCDMLLVDIASAEVPEAEESPASPS